MAMTTLLVHLPKDLKARLDALRAQGYTASGYIRFLLARELADSPKPNNGREGQPWA